jgi:hypothetical protein
MRYGPSLVVVLLFLGTWLARSRHARLLTSVDAYDLYLVHQPFAFPIAIVAKTVLHSYAVFVGWFIFVAVAMAASKVLSIAQRWFFTARRVAVDRPLPGRQATREEAAS